MSALLEAAALWKPNEKQSFKSDLPWQPVTLYYQPRSEDTVRIVSRNTNQLRVFDFCTFLADVNLGHVSKIYQVATDNYEFTRCTNSSE